MFYLFALEFIRHIYIVSMRYPIWLGADFSIVRLHVLTRNGEHHTVYSSDFSSFCLYHEYFFAVHSNAVNSMLLARMVERTNNNNKKKYIMYKCSCKNLQYTRIGILKMINDTGGCGIILREFICYSTYSYICS